MITKKFKVAVNGSMLDDEPTGVGVYSFNLINNLFLIDEKKASKAFTVFTPSTFFLNKEIKTKQLSKYLLSSRYGKIAAAGRFLWNTFYYPFYAKNFDLFINPTTHGSLFLKNQIFTIHDLLSLRYSNIMLHQRLYFKYVLPLFLKKARLIVTVSESTKKDIIHFFDYPPEKIKVLHNGYDNHVFFYEKHRKPLIKETYGVSGYLLAIGPTYPHKNFELLIQAYAALTEDYRSQHPLVIAGGKEPYLSSLKKLVNTNCISNVFFIGYVPLQLLPALYAEAFLFIFPSLHEGFGIPLLEAMASGCPVIASNTSSVPEICEEAVLYFDPLQKESLTTAIILLSNDAGTRTRLVEKGLLQVKKFSWKKTADAYNLLIEKSLLNN